MVQGSEIWVLEKSTGAPVLRGQGIHMGVSENRGP